MNEMELEPHERLRRIRTSKRCAGCHKSCANLLQCGVRLEDTLSDLLDTQIPKGELKLCSGCKDKLTATHELFKCLALIKNTPTRDGTAVRFLNSKTLRTSWFCRRCNKPCKKLADHRRTCNARKGRTPAQANSTDTNNTSPGTTHNRIIIGNGKRTARDDRQAKRVKFDLNNKENGEIQRQNDVSGENILHDSVIGENELNLNDEQQVDGNVDRRQNSVSGELLRRNSVNGESQRRNVVNHEVEMYNTAANNVVKEETIPTQVDTIMSLIIILSDDEEEMPRRTDTPKKQSRMEEYYPKRPSRHRRSSAEDNITSTSTEVETPAGTVAESRKNRLEARLFVCDVCNRDFTTNKALNTHKATKGWECSTCNYVFCNANQLSAHKRVAHPRLSRADRDTDEPTDCKCCKKVFRTRKEFAKHYTSRGGCCHGAPEGLMNSQCDCQLGTPPTTPRRRDSVRQTFRDPNVQTFVHSAAPSEATPPRRQSVNQIKVEPDVDMDIYERETPVLMLPQETVKASDTPNSEAMEEAMAGNEEALKGARYLGDVEAGSDTSGMRVDQVRSESEYHRNTSCDSSQPPGPAVKAKSIFCRRQLSNEDNLFVARGANVIRGLLDEHRRRTVDRATAEGDADFAPGNTATSPIDLEEAVNIIHSLRHMLNRACGGNILD